MSSLTTKIYQSCTRLLPTASSAASAAATKIVRKDQITKVVTDKLASVTKTSPQIKPSDFPQSKAANNSRDYSSRIVLPTDPISRSTTLLQKAKTDFDNGDLTGAAFFASRAIETLKEVKKTNGAANKLAQQATTVKELAQLVKTGGGF